MENRHNHDNNVNPILSHDMLTLVEVAGTFLHAAWKHASYFLQGKFTEHAWKNFVKHSSNS